MLYDLRLRMAYKYESPAASSKHLIRLFPRDLPGVQRPIATELSIEPRPSERSIFTDYFGNLVQDVYIQGLHPDLEIRVQARVERMPNSPARPAAGNLEALQQELSGQRTMTPVSPHHFLGETPFVRPSRTLRAYASAHAPLDRDILSVTRAIGEDLHAKMTFDPSATSIDTPHEQAFEIKRGVCQDFTHIMIACLRSIGVPAGYVSGVLRTLPPPGQPRLSGADAMHAWVRVWCGGELGWFEYDPTNAKDAGLDHIVIAYGRDYFDVSPVKGMLRTSGSHDSIQEIDLVEISGAERV